MNVTAFIESCHQRSLEDNPPTGAAFKNDEQPAELDILETVEEASPRNDLLGLLELILKNRPRLDRLIRDPAQQPVLIPRLLALSLLSFSIFGLAMVLVLNSAGVWPILNSIPELLAGAKGELIHFEHVESRNPWLHGEGFSLILAYSIGLVAATGICLPSLYFYGLLSGVQMSMLDVVAHAVKAKATGATALVGILPVYAAFGMAVSIFQLPQSMTESVLWLGLVLPFISGLWGVHSLYVGFSRLADTMPAEKQFDRECFLRRLVLSWSAVYTAVTPVMIFTLWEYFSR